MGETGKKITVLTKYINMKSVTDWRQSVFTTPGNDGKWSTQFAAYDNCEEALCKDTSVVRGFAAAAKGDKIYLLSVNASAKADSNSNLGVWFVVAKTSHENTSPNKPIIWEEKKLEVPSNAGELNAFFKKKLSDKSLVDCSVFVMEKEKKIVFVVKGEFEDGKTKNAIAFIQIEEAQGKLTLLTEKSIVGSYSFFQWEDKIFKAPTDDQSISDQNNGVMVFNGNEFTESKSSIARLRDFLKDKNNFATVKIGENNDNVLLFIQHQKKDKNVYLWMCDGNRSSKVGTITNTETGEETFYASFLYINKELFVLYQKYKLTGPDEKNKKVVFTLLEKELNNISTTLTAWKGGNDKIETLCKKTKNTVTPCDTDGLVAFLSNKKNESSTEWIDEYFYENATVTQGTNHSGGFKFSGAKAGAKWQVGKKQEGDQPYNFADPGFTLVATVKIDKDVNEKWNSILGVGLGGNEKKTIGLWCSKRVWGVGDGKDAAEAAKFTAETCVQGEKYRVVLTMKDTKISVYIDGKLAEGLPKNPIDIQEQPLSITHFYFGVNDAGHNTQPTNIESHVTVTNVLLYNRPFDVGEVKNLKECPKKPKKIKNPDENLGINTQGDVQQPPLRPDPNGEEKKDKKETSSPSRTEDGGVGGGVRVFFLLLPVLCAALPPLLHL